jgi:Cytochrome c7 and related cytochrome c
MALRGGSPVTRTSLSQRSLALARMAVAAAFFLGALTVQAQISPGPLSRAHEDVSGPTQCTSCHVVGKGSAELKCQECHTEIAAEISGGLGLHSHFADKQDCAKCHSEHNGEDFSLIHWQPSLKAFDHSQTGYRLEGKHAAIECNQCHTPAHIQASVKPLIKMKDLRKTYLGLSSDCVTCHDDPHKGQLGLNCVQCHNFVDWKAATKIDHSKTRFPLTGLHAQVACAKCHAPATPGGPARLTGMAFAKCSDCHADPHHGTFAQSCETCHTTEGWKKIPEAQQFDHSKTKFPLLGKHAQVDCVKCHTEGDFKRPVAFAKCMDCHTPDPHGGQFADRKDKGECAGCHTVDGWKPSLFDVKAHAASAYPLLGKHAAVACDECHVPAGTATQYKIAFAKCLDCHKDVHNGQFAAAPYKNQCETCHIVDGFQPSTFTIAEHQKSRFPLAGAHMAVDCAECHTTSKAGYNSKVVPYRFEDRSCTGCHTNPHGDQFKKDMAERRPDGKPKGCEACHTVKAWTDLPKFDHSKTAFPLTGAHAKVACDDCHKPAGTEGKMTEASFRSTPTNCSACHQDPHAGQFVKSGKPENCELCHNTQHWKPSIFNHETQSTFSLKGAHEKVECELCHTGHRNIDGKRVVFYKPTPRDCASCHQ